MVRVRGEYYNVYWINEMITKIIPQFINVNRTRPEAAVRAKAVVLLFLIYCLLFLPLFVGALCLVLVLLFRTLCPSSFAIILIGVRESLD